MATNTSNAGSSLRLDAGVSQHALHRRVMHAELTSDRADAPLLGVEQAQNVTLRFFGDHGAPRSSGRPTR
jgi:hypothetical protein